MPFATLRRLGFLAAAICSLISCETKEENGSDDAALDAAIPQLLEQGTPAGVGIAIIERGEVVYSGYFGEAADGVPVTEETAFNTASVAKTITAETLLALAEKGQIDLDEPVAAYVEFPDLEDDPRFRQLTPRILLAHQSGLRNWSFQYDDGRYAFDFDPGTSYQYSGAGIELAARYAEAKTGKGLEELAFEHVLSPLGIEEMALGHRPGWTEGRMAAPRSDDGRWMTMKEANGRLAIDEGNQAADDLVTTVPAYAKLLGALTSEAGLGDSERRELRTKLISDMSGDQVYGCPDEEAPGCPDAFGHAIGWQVWRYGDHEIVKHSGSDMGENAFVYFSPDRKHGAVIFVVGADGWPLMTKIIELIGQEPKLAAYYETLVKERLGRDLPGLAPAGEH